MKVKELIEKLKYLSPEAEVIIQKDSEGNSFSPLSDFWEGIYIPETTWFGEAYDYEDIIECEIDTSDGKPAIILCPVN